MTDLPTWEEIRERAAMALPVEPDFRFFVDCRDLDAMPARRQRVHDSARALLLPRGVIWCRFTQSDDLGGVWVEGWKERPIGDKREADFRPALRWPAPAVPA